MLTAINSAIADNSLDSTTSENNNTYLTKVPYYADWPKIVSAVPKDPEIEAFVANIVSQMTLAEKVGQMI